MGYFVKNRQLTSGSNGIVLPAGPTSERPVYPITGLFRFNTSTAQLEFYDGVQYQLVSSATGVTYVVDNLIGDGITTSFIMTQPVTSAEAILVFMGSIYQPPGTYSVNGTYIISFTAPPPVGTPLNVIHSYV